MMVTILRCWWQKKYIGDIFLHVGDILIGHQLIKCQDVMLMTDIWCWFHAHFVSNISHQHRCNRVQVWGRIKSPGLQTRTTSYSCSMDDEDYSSNDMISRPLPWVVRVYFKSENSMKGTLCSGKSFTVYHTFYFQYANFSYHYRSLLVDHFKKVLLE